ncbi:MAG: hypothetical protein ACTSX6_04575 [Candidatus Heimdallarchaeaceae archaeon]
MADYEIIGLIVSKDYKTGKKKDKTNWHLYSFSIEGSDGKTKKYSTFSKTIGDRFDVGNKVKITAYDETLDTGATVHNLKDMKLVDSVGEQPTTETNPVVSKQSEGHFLERIAKALEQIAENTRKTDPTKDIKKQPDDDTVPIDDLDEVVV